MSNNIKFDTGLGWKMTFQVTKNDAIDFINLKNGTLMTLSCGKRTLEKDGNVVRYNYKLKKKNEHFDIVKFIESLKEYHKI
jgi:hypothetical protein